MRGATQFARRIKQLFRTLRSKHGKAQRPAVGDPITQLVLGILTRDTAESKAREALDKLREAVVDYNELRVVSPLELAEAISGYPDGRSKTEDISRALNKIFAIEHIVSLDRLSEMSARDARTYLDRIDGLEPYTRARVRLLGMNQHAIPLDEAMLAFLRKHEIVDPAATHEEIQAFLERQIDADDALEFVVLLRKHAWVEMAADIKKGKVEKVRSVPPDRTSRNMLQLITPQSLSGEDADEDAAQEPESQSGKKKKRGGKSAPEPKKAAATAAAAPPAAKKGAAKPTTPPRPKGPVRKPARGAKKAKSA